MDIQEKIEKYLLNEKSTDDNGFTIRLKEKASNVMDNPNFIKKFPWVQKFIDSEKELELTAEQKNDIRNYIKKQDVAECIITYLEMGERYRESSGW